MVEHEAFIKQFLAKCLRRFPEVRTQSEDLLQELRMAALFSMSEYDPAKGAVTTWLMWQLRSAFDRWRSTQAFVIRRPRCHRGGLKGAPTTSIPAGHEAAYVEPELDDLPEIVRDALAQLTPLEQRIAIDRGMRGMSFPRIARRLGRSDEGVRQIWQRVRARLRELLQCTMD